MLYESHHPMPSQDSLPWQCFYLDHNFHLPQLFYGTACLPANSFALYGFLHPISCPLWIKSVLMCSLLPTSLLRSLLIPRWQSSNCSYSSWSPWEQVWHDLNITGRNIAAEKARPARKNMKERLVTEFMEGYEPWDGEGTTWQDHELVVGDCVLWEALYTHRKLYKYELKLYTCTHLHSAYCSLAEVVTQYEKNQRNRAKVY